MRGESPWWIFSEANATNFRWENPYGLTNSNGIGFFDLQRHGKLDGNAQRSLIQRSLRPVGTGHELWDYRTGRMWVGDVNTPQHAPRLSKGGFAENFHAPQAGGAFTAPGQAYLGGISACNAEFRAGCALMGRTSWEHLAADFYANDLTWASRRFYMKNGALFEELANGAVVERELRPTSVLEPAESRLSRFTSAGGRVLSLAGRITDIATVEATALQLAVGPTERNIVDIAGRDQRRLGNDAFLNPVVAGYVVNGRSTDNLLFAALPSGGYQQRIPNREMYLYYAAFGPDWIKDGAIERMIAYYRANPNAARASAADEALWARANPIAAGKVKGIGPDLRNKGFWYNLFH